MLVSLGRGSSPQSAAEPLFSLNFQSSIPSSMTYTRNDAVATYRNSSGKLLIAGANSPRFDHDENGNPLGILIEGVRTNKLALYNANPTNTAGISTGGDAAGILSIVNDSAALASAGLDLICSSGNVFKVDNSGGSTWFYIDLPGTTGNTNAHSLSVFARGTGTGSRTATLYLASGTYNIAPAGGGYARYAYENIIPDVSTRKMRISVEAGDVLYFVLPQLEEGTFASSPIVTSGSASTRQTDHLSMTGMGTQAYFNISNGFLAARYRPYVLGTGADQYPVALSDGSTTNMIALRLHKTDKDLQSNYRGAGLSASGTNDIIHFKDQTQTASILWSPSEIKLLAGGVTRVYPVTFSPSNITTLTVGARNGGNDPFWGHIENIILGKGYQSAGYVGSKTSRASDIKVIGAGQSLMVGHFEGQELASMGGHDQMIETIGNDFSGKVVVFANGAMGGSAVLYSSNPEKYWIAADGSPTGNAFAGFWQAISDSGVTPNAILWSQGEADSHFIGVTTTNENYKAALELVFSTMRAALGDIPVIIQRIGRRDGGGYVNTIGIQAIREVQQDLIDAHEWCHAGAETYDLPLYTGDGANVHLTDAGYVTASLRNSRKISSVFGKSVSGADGPKIIGANRTGANVVVTITHDAGTDFTPSIGIEGFKFFDNNNEISISSAIRTNTTTITLTLSSLPTSGTEVLYYGYDSMGSVNPTNIVKDNAAVPMPLKTRKILL